MCSCTCSGSCGLNSSVSSSRVYSTKSLSACRRVRMTRLPGEELLPQLVAGDGRVDDDVHVKSSSRGGSGVNAAGTITDFVHLNASA